MSTAFLQNIAEGSDKVAGCLAQASFTCLCQAVDDLPPGAAPENQLPPRQIFERGVYGARGWSAASSSADFRSELLPVHRLLAQLPQDLEREQTAHITAVRRTAFA